MSNIVPKQSLGFTLVELLVAIAIIAVLAALLFPVFSQAKQSAKRITCLSDVRQIGTAAQLYLSDSEGVYPQTRQSSANPAVSDLSGAIDEPVYEPAFAPLQPYLSNRSQKGSTIFACPQDSDPFGQRCQAIDPDSPEVTSYIANAYFVFGLSESSILAPSNSIYTAERRSDPVGEVDPYCDDIYHPWFNATNSEAPENEMDPISGAVATTRHLGLANYDFADGHAKALHWGDTYSPPAKDLHLVQQK